MRTLTLAMTTLFTIAIEAQTDIPVGHFRSVELNDGGVVEVLHGPTRRVTILTGDVRPGRVRVDGERLVISGGRAMRIKVVTPEISGAYVLNGGTLYTDGAFPAQAAIEARVEQGGTIDIRSIPAAAVTASVDSGGRIFTHPGETLAATIRSGGVVTYWGDVRVTKSIRDGGVVQRGTPADSGK